MPLLRVLMFWVIAAVPAAAYGDPRFRVILDPAQELIGAVELLTYA